MLPWKTRNIYAHNHVLVSLNTSCRVRKGGFCVTADLLLLWRPRPASPIFLSCCQTNYSWHSVLLTRRDKAAPGWYKYRVDEIPGKVLRIEFIWRQIWKVKTFFITPVRRVGAIFFRNQVSSQSVLQDGWIFFSAIHMERLLNCMFGISHLLISWWVFSFVLRQDFM